MACIQEAKTEESSVQKHSWLQSEFETSMKYTRMFQKHHTHIWKPDRIMNSISPGLERLRQDNNEFETRSDT